jgi:DNA-binding SARP family transcriptional activator/tetratricopeptide (TPR) repeat protein
VETAFRFWKFPEVGALRSPPDDREPIENPITGGAMYEFRTLGTIDLRTDDGTPVHEPLRHAKRVALLACLAAPHPLTVHRRETLIALLWPELDESHGRGMLRHELYELRRVLGPELFCGNGGESIGVAGEQIWCDSRAFTEAFDSGFLLEALELLQGEFLPGLQVDGGEFDRWLAGERRSLARRAGVAADRLTARAAKNGDLKPAIQWARRWTEFAPYDEIAWRRLLSLLDRAGDRAGALAAYETLAARLGAELDTEPAAETRSLAESIRGRPTSVGFGGKGEPLKQASPMSGAEPGQEEYPPDSTLTVVVVRPVENHTGDPRHDVLARRLGDRLVQGISELAYVEVVAGAEVPWTTATVTAALYPRADGVEVQARLAQAGDGGRVLFAAEPELLTSDPDDEAMTGVAARMMAATAAQYDPRVPLALVHGLPLHTPTWESWLEYIQGAEAFGAYRFEEAARRLYAAYEVDPRFVKAAIFAALALTYCGDIEGADALATEALRAGAESASDYERYFGAYFLSDLRGNRWEAYRACRELVRLTSHPVLTYLAGREAYRLNRLTECVRLLEGNDTGVGWWKDWAEWWEVFGGALHLLGDHRAELAAVMRGRARVPGELEPIRAEVRTRAALHEPNAVLSLVDEALQLPPKLITPADVAWTAAQELDHHGHREAGTSARRAGLNWLSSRDPGSRAEGLLGVRLLLELGELVEAGQRLAAAQTLPAGTPLDDLASLGVAGLLAAQSGDVETAFGVIGQLEVQRSPYLSGRHLLMVAEIHAALGQAEQSIDALRRAFAAGLPFGVELHALPTIRSLALSPDFEVLFAPRG